MTKAATKAAKLRARRWRKFLCLLFGHKVEFGPLQRSPYTVYTHWRDVSCSRCTKSCGAEKMYFDALLRADLFKG